MSKAKAQRRHARQRAMERYGIEVGRSTRTAVIDAIQSGRSTVVNRTSLRTTVHDVTLPDGDVVRVVYDKHRKEIATFLPRGEAS